MSKAVMLSVRPKWCEKIANGEKTIEVRKTRPKMNTPFKCYIYCTLPKYPHEDFIATDYPRPKFYGGGKVIGEFVCDCVTPLYNVCMDDWKRLAGGLHNIEKELVNQACLTEANLHTYAGGKNCFAWHISDLRIYDQPRELTAFRRACKNSWYCESCAMYWENNGTCGNESLQIKRPPQSWCYVEVT
nr:MAG TPA: helix-turn-helix domain-containing protein [Caudoviricetes sp.]